MAPFAPSVSNNSELGTFIVLPMVTLRSQSPSLYLHRPTFNALTPTAGRNTQIYIFHGPRIFQELMTGHATRVGSLLRKQLQHGEKEVTDTPTLLHGEVVFLSKNVR